MDETTRLRVLIFLLVWEGDMQRRAGTNQQIGSLAAIAGVDPEVAESWLKQAKKQGWVGLHEVRDELLGLN